MAKKQLKRVWAFLAYPESAPENWMMQLDNLCVPFCVSPLHDSDIDESGKVKKAHYHGIISFSGNQSFETVSEILSVTNGPPPQPVRDIRSACRYLIHADSPGKTRYPASEIKEFGGFDAHPHLQAKFSQKLEGVRELFSIIESEDIKDFCTLLDKVRAERSDLFQLLCESSVSSLIDRYLISQYKRKRTIEAEAEKEKHKNMIAYFDEKTGEVIES